MSKLINPKSDKNLLKRSRKALISSTVSSTPGLAQAWALTVALSGNAIEIRQQRAIEWIEMIKNNPSFFTKKVLSSEEFQDSFAWSFEKYIVQRQRYKRIMMRNIFLGYIKANDRNFPLERMYSLLENLTFLDVEIFKQALKKAETNNDKSFQVRGNSTKRLTEISNLIYNSLLIEERMGRWDGAWAPYVTISELGEKFAKFLVKYEEL